MRKSMLAVTTSALAAGALLVGAGTASAQEQCLVIVSFDGKSRCMNLDPATAEVAGSLSSLGYGSLGTGSLMDLLSQLINLGSVTLSVDVPNSTGSYAPGSLGSYGPEASIGQLSVGSIGSAGGSI